LNDGRCPEPSQGRHTPPSRHGLLFDIWFYVVEIPPYVLSDFPPLAWTSFAIFGVLYGRIISARPWSKSAVVASNILVSSGLFFVFVLTRLLHFGNLEEQCLRMPEHLAHPHVNQYLASVRSFFYITKYPPSVSFWCMTMSLNLLLLALFTSVPATLASSIPWRWLNVFGNSALFFYVAHQSLYMAMAAPVLRLFARPVSSPGGGPVGVGNTPAYWIPWFLGVVVMYPLCLQWARFKSTKGPDSIWRFV